MVREVKRLKKLKVVFIDWHKTLCSNLFFHNLQDTNDELFDKLEHRLFGEMPIEQFVEWMRGNLTKDDIVARLAADDLKVSDVAKYLKSSCEKMSFDRKDVLKWVRRVRKKGIKVVIATDNVDTFDDYTVPALKLTRYFDDILSSFQLRYLKNDVVNGKMLFFDDFLRKNSIKYDEAILLDDSVETSEICRKCGMQSKIIRSPEDVLKMLMMIEASCDRCEF